MFLCIIIKNCERNQLKLLTIIDFEIYTPGMKGEGKNEFKNQFTVVLLRIEISWRLFEFSTAILQQTLLSFRSTLWTPK